MNRYLSACALGASLLLGVAAAPGVVAATQDAAPQLSNMDRAQLLAYHDKLSHDLDTKAYKHIKDDDRAVIAASQTQIRALLAKVSSLKDLSEDQRLTLFNEQEKITSLIESRAKDRLVCERVFATGSHRPTMECISVGQRDQMRNESQKAMQDNRPAPVKGPGG